MIRVDSIEDIPQPARDRIKAKVMRRFLRHLQDRPEISTTRLTCESAVFSPRALRTSAPRGRCDGLATPPRPARPKAIGVTGRPLERRSAPGAAQGGGPADAGTGPIGAVRGRHLTCRRASATAAKRSPRRAGALLPAASDATELRRTHDPTQGAAAYGEPVVHTGARSGRHRSASKSGQASAEGGMARP